MGSKGKLQIEKTYIEKFKVTIMTIDDKKICRHCFMNVETNGAADEMRIKGEDAIMMVNGIHWAPDESHQYVVDLFNNASVDEQTWFSVVIERVNSKLKCSDPKDENLNENDSKGSGEDYLDDKTRSVITIDTSAMLVSKGGETTVEGKALTIIPKTDHTEGANTRRFRVTGTPGYFLKVKNDTVYAGLLDANDTSSVITFNTSVSGSENIVEFFSTLQGQDNSYIAINSQNKVVAQIGEATFLYERRGSGLISFQKYTNGDGGARGDIGQTEVNRPAKSDQPVYLAGNLKSVEDIIAEDTAFYFEEFPLADEHTEQNNSIVVQQKTSSQQCCNIQ